jgi:hypothetical protein
VGGSQWSVDLKTTFRFLLSAFEKMMEGFRYEETEKNQSAEGGLEAEEC